MALFVLVHGAWQGASTWDLVAPRLREKGHDVVTPTLTGLGDDAAHLSSAVNLSTHLNDVEQALLQRDEGPAVLVGHSYAGMVVTGVAARQPHRVQQLMYLDAFVPEEGDAALRLMPPPLQTMFQQQAADLGEGWRLPAGEGLLDAWGLHSGPARDFVRERLCDFSLNCFAEPLPSGTVSAAIPRSFIAACAEGYPARAVFGRFAEKARAAGWPLHALATGHDLHVEDPMAVTQLLLSAV